MNSRWSELQRAGRFPVLLLSLALAACGGEKPAAAPRRDADGPPIDPAQADADSLGREVFDIVDRVMAYKSSHRNRLPVSLRQAGLDSLTPRFVRRLARQGEEPLVTIAYRRPAGHALLSCTGTSLVLENSMLHDGAFTVQCEPAGGGSRPYWVGGTPVAP